jgi:D-alanyl-D-alanine dipeptidase
MSDAGFTGLPTEWWHFDADGWEQYEMLDLPIQ